MTATRCPACPSGMKGPGKYLCLGCWSGLTALARRALNRRDSKSMARLQDLYGQIASGVPLDEIQVTP